MTPRNRGRFVTYKTYRVLGYDPDKTEPFNIASSHHPTLEEAKERAAELLSKGFYGVTVSGAHTQGGK